MVGRADGWILMFDNAGFGAGSADFDARQAQSLVT